MSHYGVDVRTPIFYRQSFASALEKQSSKSYARLTHTPVIAEHLPRGAASGARIAQYATSRLRSLDELERLLRTVLEDPSIKSATGAFNVSTREPGVDEFERTVLSRASIARVQAAQTQLTRRETKAAAEASAEASPPDEALATDGGGGGPSSYNVSADRKVPRSVSFSAESPSATPQATKAAEVHVAVPIESKGRRVWYWLRGWVWRGGEAAPSSPGVARHKEGGVSAGHTRGWRREHASNTANTAYTGSSAAAAAPSPAQKLSALPVPAWVRAAFTPAAAATAAATLANVTVSPSHHRRTSSAQETCVGAGASTSLTQDDAPLSNGASVEFVSPALACGRSDVVVIVDGEGTKRWQENGVLRADNKEKTDSTVMQSPHLSCGPPGSSCIRASRDDSSFASKSRRDSSDVGQDGNADDVLRSSGNTNAPLDCSAPSSPPPSDVRTQPNMSVAGDGAAAVCARDARKHSKRIGLPLPVTSTLDASPTTGGSGTQPYTDADGNERDAKDGDAVLSRRVGQPAGQSAITFSDKEPTGTAASSFVMHNGYWQTDGGGNIDAQRPTTTPPSVLSRHTAAGTNVLARWDRHAYAVELVGWLNLLVWVRCQVIQFLRDLSGVQGVVAWSAWYWSWAQEHPRQASFHQALSSRRFWRGLWSRGLATQLSEVQYETSGHMFTLKNAFRLIVSYIGAAYTSLEQLNASILQIQHHCEMSASPIAAAAVAAAARSYMAGVGGANGGGVSITTLPELGGSINRAYAVGKRELLSNQHSMFWSPAPATMVGGDFSFVPKTRDNADIQMNGCGSPHMAHRSAFDDVVDQDSVNETAVAGAAEEVEAAAALQVLDELRTAVWAMLQEQCSIFRTNVRQLDVLESNDYFGWPGDAAHSEGRPNSNVPAPHLGALQPSGESVLFNASMLGEPYPGSPSLLLHHHEDLRGLRGDNKDGERAITARDGAVVLLQCVQNSRRLVQRLKVLVQRAHNPPASRHWQRILVAAAAIIPPFIWLYRKTPTELIEMARSRFSLAQLVVRSYLLDPITQLRESLFYVRPGVEDRRGAFERDAASLANIIRDFHEDFYPNMPLDRLEQMRIRTLDNLRAGIADNEGFGLIDQQYRHSVRHPIRSVIFGDLPRILLIQLSYQALEMSRVANGVDEVLEGNDLNFKVMALLPVFAAGGLLVSWGLFRYRANYKPVRMRLKLLWRSLSRVVSFAGSGQEVLPPFRRGVVHRTENAVGRSNASPLVSRFPVLNVHGEGASKIKRARSSRGAKGTSSPAVRSPATVDGAGRSAGVWKSGSPGDRGVSEVDPVDFTESSDDDTSSPFSASASTKDGADSVRRLNNYEQGMVLLLSHVIRSMAAEYLRSYEYFHELMEDLNDLESVQSSRHQRLATLERMRSTHNSLF